MKKNLIALSLIGAVLIMPMLVFAQPAVTNLSLDTIITKIQNAMWKVFGLLAVICFVIAGILFLTSSGDPEKVGTARRAFMWGIAGVAVGIMAYSIISLVTWIFM